MPNSGEKLTIAEFAARAGISKQRVYQLLNKGLKDFLILENGRKYIDSAGLEEIEEARKKQGFTMPLPELEQDLNKALQTIETLKQDLEQELERNKSLTAELNETRAALDAVKPQAAALIIDIDRLKQDLEKTANELKMTRADLAAAREQREAAERKAAAADSECKRADAAEQQCTAKDKQLDAMQKQIDSITAALQREQEHAAELMQALAASQALHAGQLRLQMQDGEPEGAEPAPPADQSKAQPEPDAKPGFLARLFHRRKKED